MKKGMYKDIFMVTETLQNGRERRKKVSVYSNRFTIRKDGNDTIKIHNGYEGRIKNCIEVLKENHYYDIEYIDSQETYMLFNE